MKKMYQIVSRVSWPVDYGWEASQDVPTFFLDPDTHAIRDNKHAEEIARKIINPSSSKIVVYANAVLIHTHNREPVEEDGSEESTS